MRHPNSRVFIRAVTESLPVHLYRCTGLCVALVAGVINAGEMPLGYEEHIKPIFREHCVKCHGEDEHKADLDLSTFASISKGGSGGPALTPGRPSTSALFKAITAEDEADRMPPKKPPLPNAQIEMIKAWIQAGTPERIGGKSFAASRDTGFKPATVQKVSGPVPMPQNWTTPLVPEPLNPAPVTALAASPVAPLYAVGSLNAVRVHAFEGGGLLGVLPFPEGQVNVVRFSHDGSLLLVAGGEPVKRGVAVLFDVSSGRKLVVLGDETDAVMAADISPDQRLVAIGGAGKVVKIVSSENGKTLFKLGKHTDWITAVAFSPDGSKIATADRAGGLHLWKTNSGQILLTLAEHKSSVRSLAWRGDGRLLASGGEDGLLVLWDAADGWPVSNNANAHQPKRPQGHYGKLPAGVLGVAFSHGGEMLSVGRDRFVKRWNTEGRELEASAVEFLPLTCAFSFDGAAYVIGSSKGGVLTRSLPKPHGP